MTPKKKTGIKKYKLYILFVFIMRDFLIMVNFWIMGGHLNNKWFSFNYWWGDRQIETQTHIYTQPGLRAVGGGDGLTQCPHSFLTIHIASLSFEILSNWTPGIHPKRIVHMILRAEIWINLPLSENWTYSIVLWDMTCLLKDTIGLLSL